jgi:hypothetical protein
MPENGYNVKAGRELRGQSLFVAADQSGEIQRRCRVTDAVTGVPLGPSIRHPWLLPPTLSLAGFADLVDAAHRGAHFLIRWPADLPDRDYLSPLQPARAGSPTKLLTFPANDAALHLLSRFMQGAAVSDLMLAGNMERRERWPAPHDKPGIRPDRHRAPRILQQTNCMRLPSGRGR